MLRRFRRFGAGTLLAVAAAGPLWAQDEIEEVFGQGIHDFYRGNYVTAAEAFDAAVARKTPDPRVYYFQGLNLAALGRPDEAKEAFATGARLEAEGAGAMYPVGRSLERVQGPLRAQIERERQLARLKYGNAAYEEAERRYSGTLERQPRVVLPGVGSPGRVVVPGSTSDLPLVDPTVARPATPAQRIIGPTPGSVLVGPEPTRDTSTPEGTNPFGGGPAAPPGATTRPMPNVEASVPGMPGYSPAEPGPRNTAPLTTEVPVEVPVAPRADDPFTVPPAVTAAEMERPAPGDPAPITDPFGTPTTPTPAVPAGPVVTPAPETAADPFGAPGADPFAPGLGATPETAPSPAMPAEPNLADPFGGDAPTPAEPPVATPPPAAEADPFGAGPTEPVAPAPAAPMTDPPAADPFGEPAPATPPEAPAPAASSDDPFGAPAAPTPTGPAVPAPASDDPFGAPPSDAMPVPATPAPAEPPAPETPEDPFGAPAGPGAGPGAGPMPAAPSDSPAPAEDPFGAPPAAAPASPATDDPFGAPPETPSPTPSGPTPSDDPFATPPTPAPAAPAAPAPETPAATPDPFGSDDPFAVPPATPGE